MSETTSTPAGALPENSFLAPAALNSAVSENVNDTTFFHCLFDNIKEGAILVDSHQNIRGWNQAVELTTGISRSRVFGALFTPSLLMLTDQFGDRVEDGDCPIAHCVRSKQKQTGQYTLIGRSGREVIVNLTIIPVVYNSVCDGAVVLLEDTSQHMDMQQQIRDLHQKAILDPLTQVANRSEFERLMKEYVKLHKTSPFNCSLIICDLDFFKKINDDFGHHIGDQALVSFAQLLKQFVRSRDIVARYGGEEFVILCANCKVQAAAKRAEEIRLKLLNTPQQMLDGKCLTASFGVTQLQIQDSATDFFVRADEALALAKQNGRNRVEQADAPASSVSATRQTPTPSQGGSPTGIRWQINRKDAIICQEFTTAAPVSVLAEQLRGFKDEYQGRVLKANKSHVEFMVTAESNRIRERYMVDVEFYPTCEIDLKLEEKFPQTVLRITVRKARRTWFFNESSRLSHKVLNDLRSYLMITDESSRLKLNPAATESGRDSE